MRPFPKLSVFLLLAIFLSGCTPKVASPAGASIFAGLQAWVDAPLDGTVLEFPARYTLVCHGTDPSGVQALEFGENDRVLTTHANPDAGGTLFNASVLWEPNGPGTYTLKCRAQNTAGDWSGAVSARVTVTEKRITLTPTASLVPTITLTATLVPTITLTVTPTPTFTPTQAILGFSPQASNQEFNYQHDCVPNPGTVTITVIISNAANIRNVYQFYRLKSQSNDVLTDWENVVMIPQGNGKYQTTIVWSEIANLSGISSHGLSATFQYQFVADDANGVILGRSQVFSDIALVPCH